MIYSTNCPRCGDFVQEDIATDGPMTPTVRCSNCSNVFMVGRANTQSDNNFDLAPKPQEVGGTHYQEGVKVSPWSLQKEMQSSGSAFVDARRADAIKYTFRMKGDGEARLQKLLEDMEKANHCLKAGIDELRKHISTLPTAQKAAQ